MQSKSSFALIMVGVLGALSAAGGAFAMRAELTPYLTARGDSARVAELAQGDTDTGLSIQSQQLVLFDCRKALTSMTGQLQTGSVRRALNENCLSRSDEIATASPSFSVAWLTGAMAAAALQDWEGFNARLARSYHSGPTEQWIAELRVGLAEDRFSQLTTETRQLHEADLRLLVLSSQGIRSLADRYLSVPEFRERITDLVDTMDENIQSRFVNTVRKVAQPEAVDE